MANTVYNPNTSNLTDGTLPANDLAGKQGEKIVADLHGKYFNAAIRKNVFRANVTAQTIPVIASGLVSKFSLYNPPGSGVIAEIISTEVGQVLATTVVDVLAWYFSSTTATAAATFTTVGVANTNYFSARAGDVPSGQVQFYSAMTMTATTPVRIGMVASFGATTDAVVIPAMIAQHDGTLLLPPGISMHLAMSTAAGTATGLDLGVVWAEWPFVN